MTAPNRTGNQMTFAGLAVGLGITLAGWLLGDAIFAAKTADRFVTVRGLAERQMPADLALWPISFTVTADDLATLQERIDESAAKVQGFLGEDFPATEVSTSLPQIYDREGRAVPQGAERLERYQAQVSVVVRSSDIRSIERLMGRVGDLVKDDVAIVRSHPQFLFTALSEIKPEMIAEATRDARRAAEQFAEDSGSRVGAIRRAQQGYFSITDRDSFSPEFKNLRVVTTVEFYLIDQ